MAEAIAAAAHAHPLRTALALSLGTAISLGLARFSYALLLPPMRADLGWSYLVAGSMNTGNALGYLLGALLTPWLMRRTSPQATLLTGSLLATLFMLACGFLTDSTLILAQRVAAGASSALIFISGGLLAARLAALHPQRAGLLIGLYYGGTGLGIMASAVSVPTLVQLAAQYGAPHDWQWAWLGLAALCLICSLLMSGPALGIAASAPGAARSGAPLPWLRLLPALSGYFMFGMGYIGYMTFIIALLRDQGMSASTLTLFYLLLGAGVFASSRLWAGLLDRHRNGRPMALLNGLLALATLLPAVLTHPLPAFISGLLFGSVFLSVVASTTALVRHNLPPAQWPAGLSLFTIIFASGQIVGPTVVGWIADGPGGLSKGLVFSAMTLFVGALLATRQRALPRAMEPRAI